MINQKELINQGGWDFLIILDACRYDFFETSYDKYLNGDLRKVRSSGSTTYEWLTRTWQEYREDIAYVSGNPLSFTTAPIYGDRGFDPKNHFGKIVDVWNWGWNEEIGTTQPEDVGKATRMTWLKHPNKKIVSHFMQPHAPYLKLGKIEMEHIGAGRKGGGVVEEIKHRVVDLLGGWRAQKIGSFLGIDSPTIVKTVANRYGDRRLKMYYRSNLEAALREVKKIFDRVKGKIVVTADHGEFLGDRGVYGHPRNSDIEIVKIVPWLEAEVDGFN